MVDKLKFKWLTELPHLMQSPNRMLNKNFLVTATKFVSLTITHQDDEETPPINLKAGHRC